MRLLRSFNLLQLAATALMLAACAVAAPPTPTTTPAQATAASATPTPSATATQAPDAVVLLADDTGRFPTAAVRATLDTLAADSGFQLLVLASGAASEIPATTRIIVGQASYTDVDSYQQQAPQVHFVLFGPSSQPEQDAVTLLPMGENLSQRLAFAAGYTAALLTDDYRVGLLLPSDLPDLSTAFANGYQYYCGLCRPVYPPYVSYPATAILTPDSLEETAQSLADLSVKTTYVVGAALTTESVEALAGQGIGVLGEGKPAGSEGRQWLATIRPAPEQALQTLWPLMMAGETPTQARVPIVIEERDEAVFGQGKLRLAEQVVSDLQAGWIDPGITPP
jgi:hypothetical protein